MHIFLEKLPCVVQRTVGGAGITVNKNGEKSPLRCPNGFKLEHLNYLFKGAYLSAKNHAHWSKVLSLILLRLTFSIVNFTVAACCGDNRMTVFLELSTISSVYR